MSAYLNLLSSWSRILSYCTGGAKISWQDGALAQCMNSSAAAARLPSATTSPHGARHGDCGELIATSQLEGVQEEFVH